MTIGTIFNQSPPPLADESTLRHYISLLQRELSDTAPACQVIALDADECAAVAFALQERAITLEMRAAAVSRNPAIAGRGEKAEEARGIAERNRELAHRFNTAANSEKATVVIGANGGG